MVAQPKFDAQRDAVLIGNKPQVGITASSRPKSEPSEALLLRFHVTADNNSHLHRLTSTKTMSEVQSQISEACRSSLSSSAYLRVNFYQGSIIVIVTVIGVSSIILTSPLIRHLSQDIANILNKTYQSVTGVKLGVSKKTVDGTLDVLGDFASLVSKILAFFSGLPTPPVDLKGGWVPV